MNIKRLTLFVIVFGLTFSLQSQNIIFTYNNSFTESYSISDVQSIKFNSNTLMLHLNNGNVLSFDVNFIDNYAFNNVSSVNENGKPTTSIEVFPNPSTNGVNIRFSSEVNMTITVDILDSNGRVVENLFSGFHSGKSKFIWKPDKNVDGIFICRIQSAHTLITKRIIVL